MHLKRILACLVFLAFATPATAQEDARKLFDEVFGPEVKRVTSTREIDDDIALADKIVRAANISKAQKDLLVVMCEAAYVLGSKHPTGYDTAIEAMQLLADNVPDKATEAIDNMVTLRERAYARARGIEREEAGRKLLSFYLTLGDSRVAAGDIDGALVIFRKARTLAIKSQSRQAQQIIQRFDFWNEFRAVAAKAEQLEAKLKANPKDTASAVDWVNIQMIVMNNPAAAAKYVASTGDDALNEIVTLAARDGRGADPLELLNLAEWYRKRSDQTKRALAGHALKRASTYYTQFLKVYTKKDLSLTKARLALKSVDDALQKTPIIEIPGPKQPNNVVPPTPSTVVVDALKAIDIDKHAAKGKWLRNENKVFINPGKLDRVTIPIVPEGDYSFQVNFTLTSATGSVGVILPLRDTSVGLLVNAFDGTASALTSVKGHRAPDNNSKFAQLQKFRSGTYVLNVDVTYDEDEVQIKSKIHGKDNVNWKGLEAELDSWEELALHHEKALGLVASEANTLIIFNSATLTLRGGKHRVLAPEDLTEPQKTTVVTPVPTPPSNTPIDALKLIDVQIDTIAGPWKSGEDFLSVAPFPRSLLQIPLEVSGSYAVEMKLSTNGRGPVFVYLPVKDRGAIVQLGKVSRIWTNGSSSNELTLGNEFSTEQNVSIVVNMDADQARASIHVLRKEASFLSWSGPVDQLKLHHAWTPANRKQLALGAVGTSCMVRFLKVKPLEGGIVSPLRTGPAPSGIIGRTRSMFSYMSPKRDAIAGNWDRKSHGVYIDAGLYSRATIPVIPMGNYEFSVIFERIKGDGPVHLHLPVVASSVGADIGFSGRYAGFTEISGEDAAHNPSQWKSESLAMPGYQHVTCRVESSGDNATLTMILNGKQVSKWQGPISSLAESENWQFKPVDSLGIGVNQSSIFVHSMRLRMLSGTFKVAKGAKRKVFDRVKPKKPNDGSIRQGTGTVFD